MSGMVGIVEYTIRNKLLSLLEAKHLDVINESHMHNVPKGAETHFKVVVVSDKFEGLPLIKVSNLVVPSFGSVIPHTNYWDTTCVLVIGLCH